MLKKQGKNKHNHKIKRPKKANLDQNDDDGDSGSDLENGNSGKRRLIQKTHVKNWFDEFPITKRGSEGITNQKNPDEGTLRKEAGNLFEKEITDNFGKIPATIPRTDYNWIKTVITKGTMSDKIAAYVLLIQDNPIVNINYLKTMVSMSKVGKKRECFMTMDTLVELFIDNLLPPNRKLKYFTQQPLSQIDEMSKGKVELRKRVLLLWFFEEQLKTLYSAFIRALDEAAHDSVEANKEKAVVLMYKLLQGHPEQEATLLSQIVNKLGDPSHKIGSKVIYTLTKLLDIHPNMKAVVMNEVEKVIFRANMNRRAQYYSVCFLTQFTFHVGDSDLASNLISIYFSLFKALIKTGDVDSRMMSALLTGVSRAFPFIKSECNVLSEHINTVYKVVHLSSPSVAIHALSLLYLVGGKSPTDRFMTVLYKKIGESAMFNAAHHAMFISIIFKALKTDDNNGRVCALIKRLLQTAMHLPVPLVCGILMLISQVTHARKTLTLKTEKENVVPKLEDDDDEEERYLDHDTRDIEVLDAKVVTPEVKVEPDGVVVKKEGAAGSSWYHAANNTKAPPKVGVYDPYQRNPLHAQGDEALLIELTALTKHFHPTVALFASNIIQGEKISYSGDPLQDFTLIRFLDKFVFKNPKKLQAEENQVTTFARFGRKKYYESVGLKKLRVNTPEYLKHDEKTIPVDETFMYKYLKEKGQSKKPSKEENEEDEESDASSVGDAEFDSILEKVSKGQKDDLDFMSEIGSLPVDKDGDIQEGSGSESDDDEEDDLNEEDEVGDDDLNDDELGDDFSDEGSNAEDFDGDELDDLSDGDEMDSEIDDEEPMKVTGRKAAKKEKRKKMSRGLFAAAEEFAELLEDDQYNAGRSSAFSNKDNAAKKQLKWESNRDRWIKDKNKRGKGQQFRNKNKRNSSNQNHQQPKPKKKRFN